MSTLLHKREREREREREIVVYWYSFRDHGT